MKDTRTSFAYVWYDDARVSSSSHDADTDSGSDPVWTSAYHYDGLGRLASVGIADGRPRTVSFASAPGGQVLLRAERSAAAQNPLDQRYFVSGVQVGEITSNGNNDPERIDYGQSLRVRNWTGSPESAPFRWNTQTGVPEATFGGAGFDPINPLSGGMAGTSGRYAVQDGDTLAGIAAGLWGDASLWYMLAEANGLSGAESLVAGTSLIVPSKVTNIRNNAGTFEVYDPSRALGDLSPTAPRPPKKGNKCGAFGTILLVVVAVAVSYALPQLAPAVFKGVLGAAAAGAIGSAVSQGVGLATGIQDKFSWKGVAMAGISAGVTAGIGGAPLGAGAGAVANDVARGILASTVTQGIGVATGLQSKFSWAGVAAAGVISGVGGAVSRSLGVKPLLGKGADTTLSNHLRHAGASAASALAGAAARSLATGTSFGDNVMAVLPDVIGSTIGNAIGYGVASREAPGENWVNQEALQRAVDKARPLTQLDLSLGDAPTIDYLPEVTAQIESIHRTLRKGSIVRSLYESSRAGAGDGTTAALVGGGQLSARTVERMTLSRAQNASWKREFIGTYGADKGRYYDYAAKLQNYDNWDRQLATWDAAADAQINRELGGFLAAGVLGGATLAAGTALLGGSLIAGAVTSGVSAGTSGVPLRWALGQENSVSTFAQDSAIAIGFYGAGRAAGYAFSRAGSAADSAGVDLALKYKAGWSPAQQTEAAAKAQILNDADTVVLQTTRGGTSARSMFKRAGGHVPAGSDVDHMVDLQLGGSDTVGNMWPLNSSVNRSLGAQIQQQIKNLPVGTRINRVTIGHR